MQERITPGNTLAVQPDKPYTGLSAFGTGFLSKFQARPAWMRPRPRTAPPPPPQNKLLADAPTRTWSHNRSHNPQASSCPAKLLEEISIVDTPGVLSGEKQRIERSYNFIEVCEWFAARCDVILLLFDPHKLDISDEFKSVISTLKGHDDKARPGMGGRVGGGDGGVAASACSSSIARARGAPQVRVILNKADQVDAQQLMRVYGALMWSLGKVFNTPEVVKVYVGSFNAGGAPPAVVNPLGAMLFEKEQADLLADLYAIPTRSCDRKARQGGRAGGEAARRWRTARGREPNALLG